MWVIIYSLMCDDGEWCESANTLVVFANDGEATETISVPMPS